MKNFINRYPLPVFVFLCIVASCAAENRRVVKPAGFQDAAAMYAAAKPVTAIPQTIAFTQQQAILPPVTRKAMPINFDPAVRRMPISGIPVHPVRRGDMPGRQPAL